MEWLKWSIESNHTNYLLPWIKSISVVVFVSVAHLLFDTPRHDNRLSRQDIAVSYFVDDAPIRASSSQHINNIHMFKLFQGLNVLRYAINFFLF